MKTLLTILLTLLLLGSANTKEVGFDQDLNKVEFNQDLIDSLKKDPEELSFIQLFKHIWFLSENGLSTGEYKEELINKIWPGFNYLIGYFTPTRNYQLEKTLNECITYEVNDINDSIKLTNSSTSCGYLNQDIEIKAGEEFGFSLDGGFHIFINLELVEIKKEYVVFTYIIRNFLTFNLLTFNMDKRILHLKL